MATQNTGYQMATNLTVRRGNDARVYSLLDSFLADAPYDNIKYGFLYNWWATQDQGGGVNIIPAAMASEGWAVPSDANFTTLATYLGGASVAGGKLKETGFTYWDSPNTGATNEVGFNGRGSGSRFANESGRIEGLPLVDFLGIKYVFTAISKNGLYEIFIVSDSDNIEINQTEINDLVKTMGYSIRPVRPATAAEQLLPDGELTGVFYYGNDGKIYRVTKIGTQVWLADNLAETKWSDGSWIQGYDGGTYTPITDANWAALTTAALCAYGDDESNVLGTGTGSVQTTYPALTATELALLSISEFNARIAAFLQYVSEQESMEISDVITNSERVQNETACPIPVGEVFFDGIVDGSVAKDAVMGQTGLDGESLNITITYTISAWAGTIGKQEAITSTTRLFVSTNGGSTYNEIDSVQASIPGEAFDEFDTNDKTSTYLFENVTDPSQIHIYGAYSYGVNLEDTGGRLNVKITNVVPDSGNATVVCPDTFIQEDGVTPNEGEIGCNL